MTATRLPCRAKVSVSRALPVRQQFVRASCVSRGGEDACLVSPGGSRWRAGLLHAAVGLTWVYSICEGRALQRAWTLL